MCNTHSYKFCLINTFVIEGALLRILLEFWRFFLKLLVKINLHVLFLLDMVICCCILYDMILNNKDLNMDAFMLQLELENCANHGDLVPWQREQWIPMELTNPNNKAKPKYKEKKYKKLVNTTYNWNNFLHRGHVKIEHIDLSNIYIVAQDALKFM
jgi:hypothetical protein